MKNIISILLVFSGLILNADTFKIVSLIPGKYLQDKQDKEQRKKSFLGIIEVDGKIIKSISELKEPLADIKGKVYAMRSGSEWLVAYPGLIDLHNHTKQNILSVWPDAIGQFENRFEWRKWSKYQLAVSNNLNPWIAYGKEMSCAAFRWSELQALTGGTLYLQGPSSCVSDFAIHKVEDRKAYTSKLSGIQAPTDVVYPSEMVFVWKYIKPLMDEGSTYNEAMLNIIHKTCNDVVKKEIKETYSKESLKKLSDKKYLEINCPKTEDTPRKFYRYVYWIHKSVVGKQKYAQSIKDGKGAAIVVHLAEGSRNDKYNKLEFEILKYLELDKAHVNLVHAVGVDKKGFKHMAKKGMGIVWSPFSNLLLYGETLDIEEAKKAGVKLALGSDWAPTGAKNVQEELKIARDYIKKSKLEKQFNSEELVNMVTEYPAQMINHYDNTDGEHGVGRIAQGSMASLLFVKNINKENVFDNLIESTPKDIDFVFVDGKAVYGIESLVKSNFPTVNYEKLPAYAQSFKQIEFADVPKKVDGEPVGEEKTKLLNEIAKYSKTVSLADNTLVNDCQFSEAKVLIHQNSVANDKDLNSFKEQTGVDLDRYSDISRLLAVNLLTQSRNLNNKEKGKLDYKPNYFPSLYSCNDKTYLKRFNAFMSQEIDINVKSKSINRKNMKLGTTIESMAKSYDQ